MEVSKYLDFRSNLDGAASKTIWLVSMLFGAVHRTLVEPTFGRLSLKPAAGCSPPPGLRWLCFGLSFLGAPGPRLLWGGLSPPVPASALASRLAPGGAPLPESLGATRVLSVDKPHEMEVSKYLRLRFLFPSYMHAHASMGKPKFLLPSIPNSSIKKPNIPTPPHFTLNRA